MKARNISLIREERFKRILEYLKDMGYASTNDLIKYLNISKATVRRDLNYLSEANMIQLTRGGAAAIDIDDSKELLYNQKNVSNLIEKKNLGLAASKLIESGMTVFVDAGTTTRMIVPHLKNVGNINLVTNDVMITADVTSFENVDTTVTGGKLRKHYFTLHGHFAEEFLQNIHADIAFIGFDAVNTNNYYITNADEILLKKNIINAAKKTVALCDYTKLGKYSFMPVCGLEDIDILLTNKELSPKIAEDFIKAGVDLRLV